MLTTRAARADVGLLVLLMIFVWGITLAAGNAVAQTVLATPDGRIVTGDTTGLPVGPVDPPLTVDIYLVPETPAAAMPDPPPRNNNSALLWGYEAAPTAARILTYDIAAAPTPHTGPDCVPAGSLDGRGLAMDPLDGNLWYTFVTFPGFDGDGLIHKTTPPNTGVCSPVTTLPFGDGPGGTIQDDIGAIDIDQGSKHIWAAGYKPVIVAGVARSYFYLVNRNNGSIIHSCWIPFREGFVGNDSLAYARLHGLPGSGQYLLTDAGGPFFNTPDTLAVIDTTHCKNGARVTPVAEFPKIVGMAGIDFEWPGLLATDGPALFNLGGPPFSTPTLIGPTDAFLQDIALCGFRAKIGGGGNDFCPY